MPTASGTSVKGHQILLTGALTQRLYSIQVSSNPLPPFVSMGYLFVSTFQNSGDFRSYVVDQVRLYRPGVLRVIQSPVIASDYLYQFRAVWDVSGVSFNITAI